MEICVGKQSSISFVHARPNGLFCTLCHNLSHLSQHCPLRIAFDKIPSDPTSQITWIVPFCKP